MLTVDRLGESRFGVIRRGGTLAGTIRPDRSQPTKNITADGPCKIMLNETGRRAPEIAALDGSKHQRFGEAAGALLNAIKERGAARPHYWWQAGDMG